MAGSVINTFDKGLHQDSSYILQPDGTYRNMKNGMLISYDGNHYTVEMTKGNRVILTLTPRYLDDVTDLDKVPMPIGFISFIDKLVVFSTNDETGSGYGEIGVVSFTKTGNDFVGTYVPYYHHVDLGFSKLHKIEGFSFRENEATERVYWTDYNNEPRVFDIANPIYTDYKIAATANELVVGNTYMVLSGAAIYDSNEYGPGLSLGNIFTATVAGGTTFGISDGSPLVIEYVPIELLDWTPSRLLGNIKFKQYGSGNKYCGSSIYFYRLSNSVDGIQTSWSYASSPIHIGVENISDALTGTEYTDFVGAGTSTTLVNSTRSVEIVVSNIDTNFDTIEICCAHYTQKTDIPYSIGVILKDNISSSEMTFVDDRSALLQTVTISELTLFPASILKVKTIATNKNYNIIGNITEREEFDLDLSGVSVSSFEYPMIAHKDYIGTCDNGYLTQGVSPLVTNVNPLAGAILPNSRWLVTVGEATTNTVTYNSVLYLEGQVIVGLEGFDTITFAGTGACRPCTTRNRYDVIGTGERVEDAIQLTTGFWDYKDPAVASHNKGYWSTEKYRFGILFFDLKGNPFYVKHISDFTMPSIYDKNGLATGTDYNGTYYELWHLNPSGISISGLDIPESVMNKCSGFSIVRAERDSLSARIITQGLMTQTGYSSPGSGQNDFISPIGVINVSAPITSSVRYNSIKSDVFSFLCPDYNAGYEFKNPLGNIRMKMEEASFLLSDSFLKTETNQSRALYSKHFESISPSLGYPRQWQVSSIGGLGFRYFDEFGSAGSFYGGLDYLNYNSPLGRTSAQFYVDADPSVCGNGSNQWNAAGVTLWLDDILSVGCKKIVFATDTTIKAWDSSYDYGSVNGIGVPMLVNCLTDIDSNSQYGGSSDVAIANTLYMSTGHFQPITAQVKADTLNGTFASGIYSGENKYTFNNIEVWGGDCFVNLIDQGYGLWNNDFDAASNTMSYAITYPCECNVNYGLRRGSKVSNRGMYPSGEITFDTPTQTPSILLESYSYNTAYSTEGLIVKYPAMPVNNKFVTDFSYRERWSALKYPGETIDSFRNFSLANYRDLDGQRGQINNLKARDSKLFYWQDHSVGYTPISETQLIGGGALGDATALGVTGVIDRYSDIDTYFGNQHQHGLTETEYGFAWFDMRRRAFMVMGIGSKPEEMSLVKGLQVFFNNEFDEGNVSYPNSYSAIYNTNNLDIPEVPLMGYGIVGCYDPRFKMTYMTFKYIENNEDEELPYKSSINRDFTIGYNHVLNAFVSFYDFCPAIWHNHNDLVLSSNNPKNTKSYNVDMGPTTFLKGDTVKVNNTEYVCISDVYIPSYPPAPTKDPEYVGSIYWLAINKENEIYIQTFGADLCKFYGKVWDFEHEIVVNAKTDMAVTAQNIQVKSIGPNATSVYCDTESQSSSDLNISSTNRNYRFIDGAWFSSLPLDRLRGRLTDYYVKIKFVFKNYDTDPTVSKNTQKVTQWLKTFFVTKR